MKAKIAYILGSDSDFPQVEKGISLLRSLQIPAASGGQFGPPYAGAHSAAGPGI